MEKFWKEIPDTDGKYLIRTDGEVMAISRRVNFAMSLDGLKQISVLQERKKMDIWNLKFWENIIISTDL